MLGCFTLAVTCQGADATTPAGLGRLDRPHPVQQQFADHDASQRGYCTPGQMCSAAGALAGLRHGEPSAVTADVTRRPELSRREAAERMSGYLCR
jgi:xanthine dehydrogenase YagT iron-sulfur-binding subunit